MTQCCSVGGDAQLNNGVKIYAHTYFGAQPLFLVDVNGPKKGPNIIGRDMFIIVFRGNKVIPRGATDYKLKGCDKSISSRQDGFYGADSRSGSGCGYKYLYE